MVGVGLAQMVEGLRQRVAMMVGRGVLAALDAAGGAARATVQGVAGEVLDDREFAQDYGVSSRPHPGAEALMAFIAGLRSNGVVVRLMDRRYTIALEYGEVAIHDDLGQRVHLTRTGIVADSPLNVTVRAGQTLRLEGDVVELHAHSLYRWDVAGHGQVWYPTRVDPWTIGASAGTPHPISPPEVTP